MVRAMVGEAASDMEVAQVEAMATARVEAIEESPAFEFMSHLSCSAHGRRSTTSRNTLSFAGMLRRDQAMRWLAS